MLQIRWIHSRFDEAATSSVKSPVQTMQAFRYLLRKAISLIGLISSHSNLVSCFYFSF